MNLNNEKITETVATSVLRYAEEIERGAILSIDINKTKIRLLPL